MATWCALQVDTEMLRELKSTPEDFCKKLGDVVFSNKASILVNRLLVVGDDIDVYDFRDIMWAYTTRCRPGHGEYLFDDVSSFPLTPYMSHGESNPLKGGKILSNCLLPIEYRERPNWTRADFEHSYPESVKTRVLSNWKAMGFEQ
jgi:UbiD family decarboxylase